MSGSRTIHINDIGPVLFERSRRAKHISISLRPFSGIRVAVPNGMSYRQAEEFVYFKEKWIRKHLGKIRQFEKQREAGSEAVAAIDRAEAKTYLISRLRELAGKHGFTFGDVSVRNQKTRWGSCSYRNNVSLNMKIVLLPEDLQDYILLHELVHTRIKDHSPRFWGELDKLVGDARAIAARLRQYRLDLY